MRFIDKTNCRNPFEKGQAKEIKRLGKLTRTACKIAEENNLGLMKTRQGFFRIIMKSGLGAYEDAFSNLKEVDEFFKNLYLHENTKY